MKSVQRKVNRVLRFTKKEKGEQKKYRKKMNLILYSYRLGFHYLGGTSQMLVVIVRCEHDILLSAGFVLTNGNAL